jgi:hypothetical protein
MPIPTEPIGSIPRPPDDASTARETAFLKIRARILGTQLASEALKRLN